MCDDAIEAAIRLIKTVINVCWHKK